MPAKAPPIDQECTQLLAAFGERLRHARLGQGKTATQVAAAAGITRATLDRAELGDASVTMGTFTKILATLGMERDIARLADQGQGMADVQPPKPRRQGTHVPRRIFLRKYPQLQQLAWSYEPGAELGPKEAFQLYERNWRHLDQGQLTPPEQQLIQQLVQTIGKGVLLV